VGFNNHPFYAIKSTLNKDEVIHPDASKRMCGMFKVRILLHFLLNHYSLPILM